MQRTLNGSGECRHEPYSSRPWLPARRRREPCPARHRERAGDRRRSGGSSGELEEIVVTGTRAALIESRDLKHDAGIVQDSIVAEDLGRFPDDNVADSLSHVTGITIKRTRGGEGQYVNVRGLGPEYSIVTLNGRILATDGDGREFAFDVLPAEVISGADVYKSADASHLEGSIGGTINLSSARPLDQPGRHMLLNVEGDYNDLSEENGYKVSGVYSQTFMDDRMGLLLTATYQDVEDRSDACTSSTSTRIRRVSSTPNGDGSISADESDLLGSAARASAPASSRRSAPASPAPGNGRSTTHST
jgi:TonB-dependent receptor